MTVHTAELRFSTWEMPASLGPSEAIPILGGCLALGTWQQLVLIDFDDRPRERTVVVQIAY